MKKYIKLFSAVFILFIVIAGFIIPTLITSDTPICTKMSCLCQNNLSEIPCNDCMVSKPIFMLGLFNVVNTCSGKEIILCEENNKVGVRYDLNDECGLSFDLIGSNSNEFTK